MKYQYCNNRMEPYTHYLMWMKSRHDIVMSSINKKNNNSSPSWEEEAFPDHKEGGSVLGGFVWPPRSYCCSFCKREFRSAQALGGHMNVHRRDRAKLKQSLIISPLTPTQALDHQDHNHTSTTSPAEVPSNSPPPNLSSPYLEKNEEAMTPDQELDCLVDRNLYFGISLDEDIIRCKRRKKGVSLWKKPCLIVDEYGLQSERLGSGNKISPIMEDIDLELRLGDPPAVK